MIGWSLRLAIIGSWLLFFGCGAGASSGNSSDKTTSGTASPKCKRPPLEPRASLRVETRPAELITKVAGTSEELQLSCIGVDCLLVWSDGLRAFSLLRKGGHSVGEPGEPRLLHSNADSPVRCHRLVAMPQGGWGALVASYDKIPGLPAIFMIDSTGEHERSVPWELPEGTVEHADFAVFEDRAVFVADSGGRVYAEEVELSTGRLRGKRELSGDIKSMSGGVVWDGQTFLLLWVEYPRHADPIAHLARWDDVESDVVLPSGSDQVLFCPEAGCIRASEARDGSLTVAAVERQTLKALPPKVVIAPPKGQPFAEIEVLPFLNGHVVFARRAWSPGASVVVVNGAAELAAPVEFVADLGFGPYRLMSDAYSCRSEKESYATAWLSSPPDYEIVEMDGPDGSTLVNVPDYLELWFRTFDIALGAHLE